MLSSRIAGTIGILLLIGHLYLMFQSLQSEKENLVVDEKMRRLATITIQNFPDRKGLSDEAFWKLIRQGDPILDSWGTAFRLEENEKGEFFWKSSGADRKPGTGDDLAVKVPFVEGAPRIFESPDTDIGSPAIDAK